MNLSNFNRINFIWNYFNERKSRNASDLERQVFFNHHQRKIFSIKWKKSTGIFYSRQCLVKFNFSRIELCKFLCFWIIVMIVSDYFSIIFFFLNSCDTLFYVTVYFVPIYSFSILFYFPFHKRNFISHDIGAERYCTSELSISTKWRWIFFLFRFFFFHFQR